MYDVVYTRYMCYICSMVNGNTITVSTLPAVNIIPFWENRCPSFEEMRRLVNEYFIIRLCGGHAYGIVLELTPNGKINKSII